MPVPNSPEEAELERVPNPHADTAYVARSPRPGSLASAPSPASRTSRISSSTMRRAAFCLKSKSFKLFLASFRNEATFHEDATITIGKRIVSLVKPAWLRIGGYWYPRGGIPIDVFWQHGTPPDGVWIPDQGVAPYRGRG